jgi:hypothetical protein
VVTRERVVRLERNKYAPGSISIPDFVKEAAHLNDSDDDDEQSPQPLSDRKPPASSGLRAGEEQELSLLKRDIFSTRGADELAEVEKDLLKRSRRR